MPEREMLEFRYLAVEYRQLNGGSPVFLFAAPCNEVTEWAGIPRKQEKQGVETVGFQRVGDPRRVKKLSKFLDEGANIIANPILCAVRKASRIEFTPLEERAGQDRIGWLIIREPDYKTYTLINLLREVEQLLIERLARLDEQIVDDNELSTFLRTNEVSPQPTEQAIENDSEDSIEDTEDNDANADSEENAEVSAEFSTESHIEDFFHAVRLRRLALEKTEAPDRDEFAGFSKDALIDFLHTATIVDGQHRLLGALHQLDEEIESEGARELQRNLLAEDKTADDVVKIVKGQYARRLGISLIHSSDWAEHVFQFVVVNQKATPIPKALLGSIVATTLTDEEVGRITERLGRADIQVMDYRTIAFLEGSQRSPFRGLIKRGFDEKNDAERKLDWSVVDRLASTFRRLEGAKFPNPSLTIDYAKKWRNNNLNGSKIVAKYRKHGFDTPYEYWSSETGPWRDVFCEVWTVVRDRLADTDDQGSHNFWGSPKISNIFNDVYLSILAADFFAYLGAGRGIPIESTEDANRLANEWLDGAKKDYFARDYGLKGRGIKKSEGAVKSKWSQLWYEYRENGYKRIPDIRAFVP
ncbi:MAG TPA: hypothetical protein VF525_17755 [Pyrinomonadaceae bacterium]|jgi:hypothetical protein